MQKKRSILFILSSVSFLFFLLSCASFTPPEGVLNVPLSRDQYKPLVQTSKFSEYKGQTIIFDSIDIDAKDVENMYYLNGEQTVGYTLFYKTGGIQQPVVSFFWYALQKTFNSIGIDVKEGGPIKNAAQLNLKIMFLTDQKAIFKASLLRNGYLIMQKDITVSKKFPPTNDVPQLTKNAFEFIDLIAETILGDPDFKREFFSEKGRI